MLPSNRFGRPASHATKLDPSRARYTAPRLVHGPSEADTNGLSPSMAAARRYDACKPSVVHDHDVPSSLLHPKPTEAATATCPSASVRTSWTSDSGSVASCHV